MKIKTRLTLIVALPLICLAYFTFNNLAYSWNKRAGSNTVVSGVNQATTASNLIHALQRERGSSAGFLGSNGANFGDKLGQHRNGVDAVIVEFLALETELNRDYPKNLSAIENRLTQLGAMRIQVSNLNASVGDMAKFYTGLINQLITLSDLAISSESNAEITNRARAYLAMMKAKEAAGLERAMGANGFGKGQFSSSLYQRFADFGSQQTVLINQAQRFATSEDARAVFDFSNGTQSDRVQTYRDRARASVFGAPLTGVSGAAWFATSTERIDLMKGLEDRLANTLGNAARSQAAISSSNFYQTLIFSILTLCGSVAFTFFSATSLANLIRNMSHTMKSLEKGNHNVKISGSKRKDELGEMSRTLLHLRDNLADAAKLSVEMDYKSSAFEGSANAMMTIDRDFKVTYVNEATMALLREHADLFKEKWPTFNPDQVIGTCIDLFHKDPSHQRQMLADPSRLPVQTDISIGGLKFSLNVSAIYNQEREYVGCVLEWGDISAALMNKGIVEIIQKHQATIEFGMDGIIIEANDNFLNVMGYSIEEIRGKHHSMFVADDYKRTADYKNFWEKLRNNEIMSGKFPRVSSTGEEVWIDASYNPISDKNGVPFKVLKIATDITELELGAKRRKEMEKAQAEVVDQLSEGLESLADGDLTYRLDQPFTEDYEKIRSSFNSAVDRLQEAITGVVENANGINTGASEVSQAADDLSRRTENQAATLEETAAALDELTASVKSAADGANKANAAVSDAKGNAESSGAVVQNAVAAMSEIEKSSSQISQIIGVIDDIAFQTNLLALNAGVEAARAGDAGRGFAVVASEVRALAQRSSDAAKEIKGLISDSSQQVEKGVDLVGQAGNALKDIVESVADISTLVNEIAASAHEQSTGISEINTAVNQMDQGTQQNAAMVEQTTAASHTLTSDAETLVQLVSRFKTNQSTGLSSVSKNVAPQGDTVRTGTTNRC